MGLTVACVRTGTKYPPYYVKRLRNMVERHLPMEHDFVCYSDGPIKGIETRPAEWGGWWGKMSLFNPEGRGRILFFDLDTVIIGDLTPLAEWKGRFGICENFTRLAGHSRYPCRYGSCVMAMSETYGAEVYEKFKRSPDAMMASCRYGDQEAIERLENNASLLQREMPPGFFIGYRDLCNEEPDASVVIFAGNNKPHNCGLDWVKREWR